MITYKKTSKEGKKQVLLDGKVVGVIHTIKSQDFNEYQYQPKGSKIRGEKFSTLDGLKRVLEGIKKR